MIISLLIHDLSSFPYLYYLAMLAKLILGFSIVLAYLRYTGRTQFSQMNAIDLIGNFIIGGVIGGGLYAPDCLSFFVALFLSIAVLFGVNILYRKTAFFHRVTIGDPIPIIRNGHFLMDVITSKNSNIDILNVASQLNLQGIFSFSEVAYAQIEPSGSLTVTCDRKRIPASVVIHKGSIREATLKDLEMTEEDLITDMKRYGLEDPADIFLGEFGSDGFMYICVNGRVFPRPEVNEHLKNRQK